jgi:hypothetical protein
MAQEPNISPKGPIIQWLIAHGIDRLPLVGPLIVCTKQDHKEAAREFFIIVVFATMTFWLSALILSFLEENRIRNYFELLTSTVHGGELFIFATALLGPILAIAAEDPKGARSFPSRTWHMFGLSVLGVICAACYALVKTSLMPGTNLILNKEALFTASVLLAAIAAALRYLAIVYNKYRLRPEEVTKAREQAFSDTFARRHGGSHER